MKNQVTTDVTTTKFQWLKRYPYRLFETFLHRSVDGC